MPTAESETNKATLRRIVEAANSDDLDVFSKALGELSEPNAVLRTPSPRTPAYREVFATLYQAYPDLHIAVEDLIAEGDKVVCRNVVTGTHLGEYLGIAPTGKAVAYNEIFIFRFVNGRIAEAWGVVDVLSQMRQLGVSPVLPTSSSEGLLTGRRGDPFCALLAYPQGRRYFGTALMAAVTCMPSCQSHRAASRRAGSSLALGTPVCL